MKTAKLKYAPQPHLAAVMCDGEVLAYALIPARVEEPVLTRINYTAAYDRLAKTFHPIIPRVRWLLFQTAARGLKAQLNPEWKP